MIQTDKTPLLQRNFAEEYHMPKKICNDDMVWIILRCKTQTWKFMVLCVRLPGKRIVAWSASKVTTRSSVYQSCQVVVNSMLQQQGDTTLIIYQSCHTIVKQDDSHYMINLAPVLSENMTVTFMDTTNCSYRFPASVPKNWAISGKMEMTVTFSST
jgi:hypothetical protein